MFYQFGQGELMKHGQNDDSLTDCHQLSGLERWQYNVPDYKGKDAFVNIQAKIDANLRSSPASIDLHH